jgi:hypothetical protein
MERIACESKRLSERMMRESLTTASVISTSGSDPRVIEARPTCMESVYLLSNVYWLAGC